MWADKSAEEVLKELDVTARGLNDDEVSQRREKFGPNELPKASRFKALKIFINQFKSAIMLILFGACCIY